MDAGQSPFPGFTRSNYSYPRKFHSFQDTAFCMPMMRLSFCGIGATTLSLSTARQSAGSLCLCPPPQKQLQARCLSLNICTPGLTDLLFVFLPALPSFSFLFFPYLSCTVLPILLSFALFSFDLIMSSHHT